MLLCVLSASPITYAHCWAYTRVTPYLVRQRIMPLLPSDPPLDYSHEVALESQRHWRLRLSYSLAGFVHIDLYDLLARDPLKRCLGGAEGGHEPGRDG